MKIFRLVFALIVLFPVFGYAYQLSPSAIQDSEGSIVGMTITVESSDWRTPNQQFIDYCASVGYPAVNWVATFDVIGVSDTAQFGNGPKEGDLHFEVDGTPHPSNVYWIRCSEALSNPPSEADDFYSIVLNTDHETEAIEHATVEIYDHAFDATLTLEDSIEIYIEEAVHEKPPKPPKPPKPLTPCLQDATEKIAWIETYGDALEVLTCSTLHDGHYSMVYRRECNGGYVHLWVDIDSDFNDCYVDFWNQNCPDAPSSEVNLHPPYASRKELKADIRGLRKLCQQIQREN